MHHLNRIEFTMELWQKNTLVPSTLDKSLEHRWLIDKVILLAEQSCHAAAITLERAYRRTLGMQSANIESTLLKHLLQSLCISILQRHLLWSATMLNAKIGLGYYGIMLLSLLSPI